MKMELSDGKKEQILMFVKTRTLSSSGETNYLRLDYYRRINELMMSMAMSIMATGYLDEASLRKWLMNTQNNGYYTVKKKLDKIKSSGAFYFDRDNRKFMFPKEILDKVGYVQPVTDIYKISNIALENVSEGDNNDTPTEQ
jgi:hypothetical protein